MSPVDRLAGSTALAGAVLALPTSLCQQMTPGTPAFIFHVHLLTWTFRSKWFPDPAGYVPTIKSANP